MNYLIYFACGLGGLLFVTFGLAKQYQTDAEKANITFSFKKYLEREWLGIAMSFVSILLWLMLFGEAATKYPAIQGYLRFTFVGMGGIGSWALQLAFGKTKNWIRNIVDEKTNIADALPKDQKT